MRVACIGEAMVELSLDRSGTTAQVGFAGDTLNTGVYLKRAAPELDVSYVTRLGRDAFSDRLRGFITSHGLETDRIEVSTTETVGLYAISTDAEGERSFTYWRGQSAARGLFQSGEGTDFTSLVGIDVVFLSAITLAILPDPVRIALFDFLRGYRARGGRVVFDSNYRPKLWETPETARARIAEMWRLTDIALPSVDDEMAIFGDVDEDAVLARFHALGVGDGALKCGATGPRSLGVTVEQTYPEATDVVDTTAAGDSFNGGYLGAILTGATQAEAMMAGHELAAYVVGHRGAIAPPR
ncbi:MAG: sugar kinase [Pseudomonadota bacterium]